MVRNNHLPIAGLTALLFFFYWGCTEIEEDVSPHPEGWAALPNPIHSPKVSAAGFEGCTPCHGTNLDGGSSGLACSSDNCHANGAAIPHTEGWASPGGIFHGDWVRVVGINPCSKCHGEDLSGGFTNVPCGRCHPSGGTNTPGFTRSCRTNCPATRQAKLTTKHLHTSLNRPSRISPIKTRPIDPVLPPQTGQETVGI